MKILGQFQKRPWNDWLTHDGQILSFIDDPKTFVRASSVSKRWREIVMDDQAWKILCEKHAYRRMSNDSIGSSMNTNAVASQLFASQRFRSTSPPRTMDSVSAVEDTSDRPTDRRRAPSRSTEEQRKNRLATHRSHFKHRYMVESAWKKGGLMTAKHITPDPGVVTSLHLTKDYIIVALDNAKIHVFNTGGNHQRTLQGHVMGVWAMVPWENTLVSGGCDRDVRVWNMATG